MKLILSEDLTNKCKENLINALYEITPRLPIFINYKKPITDILISSDIYKNSFGNIKKNPDVYVKVIGDDIYSTNKELEEKISKLLKDNLDSNFLYNYYKQREIVPKQKDSLLNVEIIDNIIEADIELFSEAGAEEEIYYLFNKENKCEVKNIVPLMISSFEFDDIKSKMEETLSTKIEKMYEFEEIEVEERPETEPKIPEISSELKKDEEKQIVSEGGIYEQIMNNQRDEPIARPIEPF